MINCLIWGTGNYCNQKIDYIKGYHIVGYVDRKRCQFRGNTTYLPEEIVGLDYDKLLIMSFSFIEIIQDCIRLGIPSDRIVPGISIRPYFTSELEIMGNNSEMRVTENGLINYFVDGQYVFTISDRNDLDKLRRARCNDECSAMIQSLPLEPVSRLFGATRGGSIARYYIDDFIKENKELIKGYTLEIGDDRYTKEYGCKVKVGEILYFKNNDSHQNIVQSQVDDKRIIYGDLRDGIGIPDYRYDCIILTQVINFMSDISMLAYVLKHKLKKGGVALLTASGITPISRFDMDRWGHFVNYTKLGLAELFRDEFDTRIKQYGNCKMACAFLQGMSYREFRKDELEYYDEDYPIIISAVLINDRYDGTLV